MRTLRSAAFIMVVLTAGPLLTMAVQIQFAPVTDPTFPPPPATASPVSEMGEVEDDSPFNITKMTEKEVMELLCNVLPAEVKDCKALPRERRAADLPAGDLEKIVALRKRRSYYYWRPRYPSWWKNRHWHNHQNPATTQIPTTATTMMTTTDTTVLICPNPIDQSAPYRFSADIADYPATEIAKEMIANVASGTGLADILLGYEFLDDTDTTLPTVLEEDFRKTGVVSCPSSKLRLYSYDSLLNVQSSQRRCWVLQNFGGLVNYYQCGQKLCNTPTSGNSQWQNLCLPKYEVVHFWTFCPHYPVLQRFRRDAVVLASACTCTRVKCDIS